MKPIENSPDHSYADHQGAPSLNNLSESLAGLSVGSVGAYGVTQVVRDAVGVNNTSQRQSGNLSVLGEGLELRWGSSNSGVDISAQMGQQQDPPKQQQHHQQQQPQQQQQQRYGNLIPEPTPNTAEQRKRGESIDLFLSRSPSQTLGTDFLNFRKEDQLESIPSLNIGGGNVKTSMGNQQAQQYIGSSDNPAVHGRQMHGNGRDMSPSCSVTGTSASSRSASPSWDGTRRSSTGSGATSGGGKTILAYQQQGTSGLGNVNVNMELNRQHSHSHSQEFTSSVHEFNAPSNSFQSTSSFQSRQETSLSSGVTGRGGHVDMNTSYESQQLNHHQSHQHHDTHHHNLQHQIPQAQPYMNSVPNDNTIVNQQQQQQQQDSKPPQQQVFYMAVPTPDGQGQVLQPVQMVQLPGQPNAFVLPSAGGSNPGSMHYQPPQQDMNNMPQMQGNYMPQQQGNSVGFMDDRAGRHMKQTSQQQYGYGASPRVGGMGGGRVKSYAPVQNVRTHSRASHPSDIGDFNDGSAYGYGGGGTEDSFSSRNESQGYGEQHLAAQQRSSGGEPVRKELLTNNEIVANLYASPKRPPLRELLGHVRRLSRDQVGCRLLQQALDEEGDTAATSILNEGLSFWGEAMVDPFGNYLFQKILEKITPDERVVLIKTVSPRLVNASLNLHGTRSVQKVVELCAIDEANGSDDEFDFQLNEDKNEEKKGKQNRKETAAEILTRSLTPAAARLCIDSHGNHVIQRILLKLPYKYSQFVFEAVANSVGDVARHRHGCCVIQRCLDSPPSMARSNLVRKIVEKSLELMQDAYGNYVVQYVLDVCSDEDVHSVCESVVGKVSLLAIQKFSSNVMEKCLERCTDRVRESYLEELSEQERIRELMMDPFGNYVIQRALAVASHTQALKLVDAMRPHLMSSSSGGIRNTAGGRRILAKIERRFPHFNINEEGSIERAIHRKGAVHHEGQVVMTPTQRGNRRGQKKPGGRDPQPSYPPQYQEYHDPNGSNYFMVSGDKVNYDHL
uniref:PUM-HD domain-containing protein n=1 Tax=Chaetoceros debilis TaxID=122233 RepID=A0A7S3Q974_9STRA|eukprot:CAMPEP_0194097808 /NCGR_PEP_ID=MMETSP0149-20130528/58056_1 /TAXON_ID=122233 /ORGANISM="Chaetoceros debilis, Strain MM31A-1" /LENGTH=1009 /DNA_ID=CAMNT_0038783837 /DNA_START=313 /DNA_END=3342 /DNA_ORIENTATION=+